MIEATTAFLDANALVRKEPIWLFEIDTYTRAFTNKYTGVGGQYDWIKTIDDFSSTVSDLEGGADLGELVVTVQDVDVLITADFPTFCFEGKAVTLKTGFVGMNQSEFITLFTGVIDTVASANSNMDYVFTCTDNLQRTSKVIYTVGDDGKPTDSDHPKTLNDHPLNILIDIFENELSLTTDDYDETTVVGYRDSIFAGLQFTFSLTSAPVAREFIEQQIMQPLGGYLWTDHDGKLTVHFSGPKVGAPALGGSCVGAFTDGTGQIVGSPFLVGYGFTLTAPVGATQLQMGMADNYYADNAGTWYYNVFDDTTVTTLGSTLGVAGAMLPWEFTGGINSDFPNSNTTGGTTPLTVSVTAGHIIRVAYSHGLASYLGFSHMNNPLGDPTLTGAGPGHPAYYVYSPQPVATDFVIDHTNTVGPPDVEIPAAVQADLVNQMTFRFDNDGDHFTAEAVETYDNSVLRYGMYGQTIVESDGMRSGFQGYFLAAQTANLVFSRYGAKNLRFDDTFVLDWTGAVLELGDLVSVTNSFIPDRLAGVLGISGKVFEVLGRSLSFASGRVTLTLLDVSLRIKDDGSLVESGLIRYYIAPSTEPVYASASADDKAHYMFMCDDSDVYSNSDAANLLT